MIGTAAAIIGSAVLGAGASLIGSGKAASAAEKGADAQAAAANHAADLQHEQYLQTRADYAPWRDAGGNALKAQSDILGLNGDAARTNSINAFHSDPGYAFTRDEAIKGVDRSAAARGLLTSGATIKAIQDRASNLADQSFGNYFNRLAGVSGTGQTATAGTAQAGSNAATAGGNALIAGGNAMASGYNGAANAFSNGVNGVVSSVNNGLNNYFAFNGVGVKPGYNYSTAEGGV